MASELPEFAEEYGFRERVRLALFGLATGAAIILAFKLWLLPAFIGFLATARCQSVFGMPGSMVISYSLFVGLPVLLALVFAFVGGIHGLRILRDGQCPPIGAKVLRRTRIRRGVAARRVGYLSLLLFAPFLALAIWGLFQSGTLAELIHQACAGDSSLGRTGQLPRVASATPVQTPH
jgi:hypothetical protein